MAFHLRPSETSFAETQRRAFQIEGSFEKEE
jgi:hypothetical protein